MSVSEYTNKFKHLVRLNTMAINEEWQCRKFENGLRSDMKLLVSSLCIKSFPAMVERAKVLEKNTLEVEQQKKLLQQSVRGPISSRNSPSLRRTPYTRPSPSTDFCSSSSQLSGPHYKSACPQLVGGKFCVRCRKKGRVESECNMGRRAVVRPPNAGRSQSRGSGRAQAVGRVYALTGVEAASLGNLIISTCLLFGVSCCVLFDSGATHSFISKACVEKLGLTESEMQFDLVVSSPTAGEVRTSTVCRGGQTAPQFTAL
ncbi:uncharacterized protein LOC108327341 [Vigna angularis]|uniref:uncharacterized protein LOC108327341 n=1 Tax=Phaseolus angularis TaxID=3914 RepID=UPI00080A5A55|nr:uncharacterized protein LOC108327341 [Vigna angularis]